MGNGANAAHARWWKYSMSELPGIRLARSPIDLSLSSYSCYVSWNPQVVIRFTGSLLRWLWTQALLLTSLDNTITAIRDCWLHHRSQCHCFGLTGPYRACRNWFSHSSRNVGLGQSLLSLPLGPRNKIHCSLVTWTLLFLSKYVISVLTFFDW